MRRTLALVFLLLAAQASASGQSGIPEAAREAVNEGASLYRAGRFAEAQARFESALRDAPESAMVALFVARAIQQQYRPGLDEPANRAKALEAVAAYERVQQLAAGDSPFAEDAYKAIVFLHAQMRDEGKVRETLLSRALDESVAAEKRAEAFVILASKQWQCSYDLTELPENKRVVKRGGGEVVQYKPPRARADLARVRGCVARGLGLVEQAERLDPANPNVFSYKANLLREAGKLAEMEGDWRLKGEHERLYLEAVETHRRVSEARARENESKDAERPRPAADDDPPDPRR